MNSPTTDSSLLTSSTRQSTIPLGKLFRATGILFSLPASELNHSDLKVSGLLSSYSPGTEETRVRRAL